MLRWVILTTVVLLTGCASGDVSKGLVKYRGPAGEEVWCGGNVWVGGLLGAAARTSCIQGAEEKGWTRVD